MGIVWDEEVWELCGMKKCVSGNCNKSDVEYVP